MMIDETLLKFNLSNLTSCFWFDVYLYFSCCGL